MTGNANTSVYIGNLDERVDERVIYEIMVQAGPLVDVHMPRDRDTKKHKGYAFAEYTSEKSAQYAVELFTGLVSLHQKQLRFKISGQDKSPNNQFGNNNLIHTVSNNVKQHEVFNDRETAHNARSLIDYSSPDALRSFTPTPGVPRPQTPASVHSRLEYDHQRLVSKPGSVHSRLGVSPTNRHASPFAGYSNVAAETNLGHTRLSRPQSFNSHLSNSQSYNTRLVSLGQRELYSRFPSRDYPVVNH